MTEAERQDQQDEDKEKANAGEGVEDANPAEETNWREQAEQYRNDYLRALADMENLRKRLERQMDDARNYAVERFARELLPVVDSLELALSTPVAGGEGVAQLRQGLENTLSLFFQALAKAGVAPVEADAARFDPHRHQAIAMVEAEGEPNRILAVHQKGYVIHDRLLRPAMVTVAKAASGEPGRDPSPGSQDQ
ncbi:MAG: nucleotide exchange factor GrpE [Acidithiobacillus sp.]|uniref:nucleotide exchange factor GrpE n=1 Tax=Acidithiobacillus sp. TaxID=1872118 RepID=UPI003D052572